jgi:hypothetical protein
VQVLDFFDYAASLGARFVLKTDDDTFLFIDRILNELKVRPHITAPWMLALPAFSSSSPNSLLLCRA